MSAAAGGSTLKGLGRDRTVDRLVWQVMTEPYAFAPRVVDRRQRQLAPGRPRSDASNAAGRT
jgi:hypothetical protein